MSAEKKIKLTKIIKKKASPSAKKKTKSKIVSKEKSPPPVKEQSKPAKETKGLPESILWLIEYANIGSKPGKLNPIKCLRYQEIKRPPIDPPSDIDTSKSSSEYGTYFKHDNHLWKKDTSCKLLNEWKDRDHLSLEEYNDLLSLKKDDSGKLLYAGKDDDHPSLEEYNDFLRRTHLKSFKRKDYEPTSLTILIVVCSSLIPDRTSVAENFIPFHYKYKKIPMPEPPKVGLMNGKLVNGLEYPHDKTPTQAACAYILDYWHNHKDLHRQVRQCNCCGTFWIEDKPRKKYCCKKCEDRFNQASRQVTRESVKKQREALAKKNEKIVKVEIVDFLSTEGGYTKNKADAIYEDEKSRCHKNVKSLDNFKRTYGTREGLV